MAMNESECNQTLMLFLLVGVFSWVTTYPWFVDTMIVIALVLATVEVNRES